LVLPAGISTIGMLLGGAAVMSGFVWTMFDYYGPQSPGDDA
jgi:hypothetical protein